MNFPAESFIPAPAIASYPNEELLRAPPDWIKWAIMFVLPRLAVGYVKATKCWTLRRSMAGWQGRKRGVVAFGCRPYVRLIVYDILRLTSQYHIAGWSPSMVWLCSYRCYIGIQMDRARILSGEWKKLKLSGCLFSSYRWSDGCVKY
jgi:hypothetical protein